MMTDRDKHLYCYQIWCPVCALDCCIYIWCWLIVKVKGQCQVFSYLANNFKKLPVYWAVNLSMCYLLSDLFRLLVRSLPRNCFYWFSLTGSSTVAIAHINLLPGSIYIFTIKSRQRLSFVSKLILFWPTSPCSTETFTANRGRTSDCSWEKYNCMYPVTVIVVQFILSHVVFSRYMQALKTTVEINISLFIFAKHCQNYCKIIMYSKILSKGSRHCQSTCPLSLYVK